VARFLVATHPITGHVLPGIPIVTELVRRGHDVHWYVGAKFRPTVERSGAAFEPYVHALDFDDSDYDAAFPERRALRGLRQIRYDFRKIFVEQVEGQHRDLSAILERFPADALLGDTAMIGPFSVSERGGPPNAVYNITCLGIPGRGLPPFGLGLLPDASRKGLIRNSILGYAAANVIFGGVSRELERQCRRVGIAPRKFAGPTVSDYLYLQPSVPSFEYDRPDLPPQVHYVGSLVPPPPADPDLPDWWPEVVSSTRPVVLVTQGTVATAVRDLVSPTLLGLADEDVLVVAAGVPDVAALGLPRVPANARVAAYLPFSFAMEPASVYVTNGGYGGVQYALSAGVPIVAAGTSEDKPEVANRVAYSGVGRNLRTATPTPLQVRDAVRSLLDEPSYRAAAGRVARELAAHDAAGESADLLERLAATRLPVTD
jgi:UDP:flavonoid glycosyltransferase YjiC (YdhE family)